MTDPSRGVPRRAVGVAQANGSATTSAVGVARAHGRARLGLAAQDRQGERPEARGDDGGADAADLALAERAPARRAPAARRSAGRAGGGSACPSSAGARRSPGRRSSPSVKLTARSTMPASSGITDSSASRAEARAAGLDAHDLGGVLGGLDGAGGQQRVAHARRRRSAAREDVQAEVGADDRAVAAEGHDVVLVGARAAAGRRRARPRRLRGPIERQQPELERALVQLGVCQPISPRRTWSKSAWSAPRSVTSSSASSPSAARAGRRAFGPCWSTTSRSGRAPAASVGDLVGHLAVEELAGLRAGQQQLAGLGAIDQRRRR